MISSILIDESELGGISMNIHIMNVLGIPRAVAHGMSHTRMDTYGVDGPAYVVKRECPVSFSF